MAFPLAPTPAFLGSPMLGLGVCRLFAAQSAYRLFGLPLSPSSPPSPFLYANAGRDLALGLTYVLLGLQRNQQGLKALIIGTAVAAQIDAWTVWAYGGLEYGGWRGKWKGHCLGGIALGLVAWKGWGL